MFLILACFLDGSYSFSLIYSLDLGPFFLGVHREKHWSYGPT
jgi:hypothetical protein